MSEPERSAEERESGSPPSGPGTASVAWARRWAVAGLLATMAVAALFTWVSPLPALDTLVLPLFLVMLPVLSAIQVPFVRDEELERIPVYVGSSLSIVVIGGVSLLLGARLEGLEGLGLGVPEAGPFLATALALTAFGVGMMELFHRAGSRETAILRRLLPQNGRERRVFVGVALAAGTGEELAYRGYVLVGLQAAGAGIWTAAAVSSVAFGFLHAYQGAVGVVRTAILGMGLAISVIITGSLLPAMTAHVLIDLLGGLVLGRRYTGTGNPGGG